MRYRKGDRVRIKSLEWYNENKSETGFITFNYVNFMPEMSRYCGEILTINQVVEVFGQYTMSECGFLWTDEMIECLVDEEPQDKMVSLNKVCDLLYSMLTTQDIYDYDYVTASAYDTVEDFVEDFRKTMEK